MQISRPLSSPSQLPARETPVDRESPLWQAAEGMEANFMKEMLRNMRKTVQESPEMANNRGFQIFRGMLDDHYAETATKTQGIGLAEIIVNQVLEMQGGQPTPAIKPLPIRPLAAADAYAAPARAVDPAGSVQAANPDQISSSVEATGEVNKSDVIGDN